MDEISGRTFPFYERFAARHGIAFDELVAGLDLDLPRLRAGSGRFSWDAAAQMCARLEARAGLRAMLDAAPIALDTPQLIRPIQRLAGLLASPSVAYRVVVPWATPVLYRHVQFQVRELAPDRLEVRARMPENYQGSVGFFSFIAGAVRVLPRFMDLPEARELEREVGSHGLRVVIEPPPSRWASRLRVARRLLGLSAAMDELVRQEEALREQARALEASERFGRTLLGSVQEVIGILELDGTVRYLNESTERVLGYPIESLRGRSVLEIVHPDDAIMITSHLSAGAEVPGYSVTVTARVRHASGEWRELEVSGINLRDDDVIHGLLVHGRDVTERNRAQAAAHERERAYSLVLQNLSGMAYQFSVTQGKWRLVTDGCELLLGYTKDELVQGRGPALPDLVSPEDRSIVHERREAAVLSGKPYSLEHRVQTRAGKTRWVLDVGRGARDAGGALVVEGFMTDVTSRKRLEEELTHSQRLDGLGRLAGGVAHDFNNLLAAMLGYASIVIDDLPPGSPSRDDVQQIIDAANRAAELTRQLLAFARKQVIQPRALDLGEVVLGLDRLLRRVLREDIELVTRPCPDLWRVQADPSQVEQVLLNLAVNARDAMPAGGTLTIETCNATFDSDYAESHAAIPAGEYVMLAVSDTGVGMEPEVLRHVFEPFFTTKEVGRGTGLGLATCYGIVAQAGGHILVYSELGRGTTFKIYLPRGASTAPAEARAAAAVKSSEGSETILVVEDHPMLRDVSARALRAHGYRVLVAANGADALRVLEAEPGRVDLLLTDVVMPSMGGHELADRVRALRPDTRVLYVSGYTDNSVIQQGVPQSGVAFLAKPFTPAVLCAKAREVLDS